MAKEVSIKRTKKMGIETSGYEAPNVQVQAKVAFEALGRSIGMGIVKESPMGQPPVKEERGQWGNDRLKRCRDVAYQ